jgi:uncharacterized Zn-finger protein
MTTFTVLTSLNQEEWVDLEFRDYQQGFEDQIMNNLRELHEIKPGMSFELFTFKGCSPVGINFEELRLLKGKKVVVCLINPLWNKQGEEDKEDSLLKDTISLHKYKCFSKACRKSYSLVANLINHQKIHVTERPHPCDFQGCKKAFMTAGHLRSHKLTHSAQKEFICQYDGCGKSYNKKARLEVHLKTHTGEKSFICHYEECRKAFYEKGNLKTHLRTHTGEKPYICKIKSCAKRFATQGHLNAHFKKHEKEESEVEEEASPKVKIQPAKLKGQNSSSGMKPLTQVLGSMISS